MGLIEKAKPFQYLLKRKPYPKGRNNLAQEFLRNSIIVQTRKIDNLEQMKSQSPHRNPF